MHTRWLDHISRLASLVVKYEDLESAAVTPVTGVKEEIIDDDDGDKAKMQPRLHPPVAPSWPYSGTSTPNAPPGPPLPRPHPPNYPAIAITVNARCPCTYHLPPSQLPLFHHPGYAALDPSHPTNPQPQYYLPNILSCDFHTYHLFLRTGTVLPYPHSCVPYALDSGARQCISAIALARKIGDVTYSCAAENELFTLAPHLPRLQEYVEPLCAATDVLATRHSTGQEHPARKLLCWQREDVGWREGQWVQGFWMELRSVMSGRWSTGGCIARIGG